MGHWVARRCHGGVVQATVPGRMPPSVPVPCHLSCNAHARPSMEPQPRGIPNRGTAVDPGREDCNAIIPAASVCSIPTLYDSLSLLQRTTSSK